MLTVLTPIFACASLSRLYTVRQLNYSQKTACSVERRLLYSRQAVGSVVFVEDLKLTTDYHDRVCAGNNAQPTDGLAA